jgi:hypothetical protein
MPIGYWMIRIQGGVFVEFKLIIAGGRDFSNYEMLKQWADYLLKDKVAQGSKIIIISGTANGGDKLGERYAKERGFDIIAKPADWDRHGKSAGYKRNVEMAETGDALLAFWDGASRGTNHMINIAKERGLPYRVIGYDGNYIEM